MNKIAVAGFTFITCLLLGVFFGLIINSLPVGGAIGFGIGLASLLLLRKQ